MTRGFSRIDRPAAVAGAAAATLALIALTAAYTPGMPTPQPNLLINPTTEIDQANEGAAVASSSGVLNAYVVDGIKVLLNSTATTKAAVSCQRTADAPTGYTYSLKCTVTTGASSVGAGDYLIVAIPIEADAIQDARLGTASAQTLCRQWQVKASTGSYSYGWALQNFAQTRSLPNAETIAGAASWTPFSSCFSGDTGGTWVTSGSGGGAYLIVTIAAGSTYQGTGGAWAGSNYFGTSALSNSILTTAGATFEITNAKLEISPVPTPFRHLSISQELARCERYYEKTYDIGTAPGTATGIGSYRAIAPSTSWQMVTGFRVTKRAAPTMTLYSTGTGAAGYLRDESMGSDLSGSSTNVGTNAFLAFSNSVTSGHVYGVHFTADSRL
ncbi:MAG TPA: hypothetical protein VET89_11490 [Stellaceae bacterium]|nr:hypothetical protein [Stellaceae bacterium]